MAPTADAQLTARWLLIAVTEISILHTVKSVTGQMFPIPATCATQAAGLKRNVETALWIRTNSVMTVPHRIQADTETASPHVFWDHIAVMKLFRPATAKSAMTVHLMTAHMADVHPPVNLPLTAVMQLLMQEQARNVTTVPTTEPTAHATLTVHWHPIAVTRLFRRHGESSVTELLWLPDTKPTHVLLHAALLMNAVTVMLTLPRAKSVTTV
jgi:hypothetical protein